MTTSDVLPSDPVSAESARAFTDEFLAAWNSHDPERLVALSDPAVRWEDPYIPGGRLDGHDALRDWLAGTWRAMPDLISSWTARCTSQRTVARSWPPGGGWPR